MNKKKEPHIEYIKEEWSEEEHRRHLQYIKKEECTDEEYRRYLLSFVGPSRKEEGKGIKTKDLVEKLVKQRSDFRKPNRSKEIKMNKKMI